MPTGAAAQLKSLVDLPDVARAVILPDIHVAGNVCVGLALATRFRLYPEAAGADIGCGILAVPLSNSTCETPSPELLRNVLSVLRQAIPIHRKRAQAMLPLPEPLHARRLSSDRLEKTRNRLAVAQYGTLGRGNHFVEFMKSEGDGRHWLVVHCGSRGIGQAITDDAIAQSVRDQCTLCWLDSRSEQGVAYLDNANWARRYAAANRRAIVESVAPVFHTIGFGMPIWSEAIKTEHDFVEREKHDGDHLLIHRKGVQSLLNGALGLLPSSMGQPTLIVRGRSTDQSLRSVSHGCGRMMSRSEAAKRIRPTELHRALAGLITHSTSTTEAPQAFRPLRDVVKSQRDLFRRVETLRPILCYKSER